MDDAPPPLHPPLPPLPQVHPTDTRPISPGERLGIKPWGPVWGQEGRPRGVLRTHVQVTLLPRSARWAGGAWEHRFLITSVGHNFCESDSGITPMWSECMVPGPLPYPLSLTLEWTFATSHGKTWLLRH